MEEIQTSGTTPILATEADVQALESSLWITFPEGYREFVTRLGEGTLGGFVRIYPPWRIGSELAEWRRRIGKYWFWDDGADVLPKARALECVIVGDTVNGDELVFHPNRPSRLFILPRDSEEVFEAGPTILDAIDWISRSGQLIDEPVEPSFEPFDSREIKESDGSSDDPVDPEGESLDDLIARGKEWADRHSARKLAEEDVNKQLADLTKRYGARRTASLVSEAIVVEASSSLDAGYQAIYRIADEASRLEVGTFVWHMSDDSRGSSFSPNQANLAKLSGKP